MTLSYDFDIHWIIPQGVFADPKIGDMLNDIGFNPNARGNYVALFRDPNTVDALRGASKTVQEFFLQSGFGLNVYDSGAPSGRYPAEDEAARTDAIGRLSENLTSFRLQGEDFNGFEFSAFLEYVVAAKPIDMTRVAPPTSNEWRPEKKVQTRRGPDLIATMTLVGILLIGAAAIGAYFSAPPAL